MKQQIIPKNNRMLGRARELRREMTPQERKLWYEFLRYYPVKIYKQRIIESFIVDFYCAAARLVIELDGSQHYLPEGIAYDRERAGVIEGFGLTIIRFSNSDIDRNFTGVCDTINVAIKMRME